MSNKISNKNVANIEEDIKNIKQYINLVLNKGYCDCNELNVISTGRYCDGSKNVACSMQNILAEREQDKKRIKELEELREVLFRNYQEQKLQKGEQAFKIAEAIKNDYIPKQKVKDKIKEIKLSGGSDGKDNDENLARELVIDILQELLEGEE